MLRNIVRDNRVKIEKNIYKLNKNILVINFEKNF